MAVRNTATIDARQLRALARFYDAQLKPLSAPLASAGPSAQSLRPGSESSYFVSRSRTRLSRSDFELRLGDAKQAEKTLEQAWGRGRFRDVVRPLIKLARLFRDVEERPEPSTAFYEMF